jgi:uncharacterized protein (TIGR02271 family)
MQNWKIFADQSGQPQQETAQQQPAHTTPIPVVVEQLQVGKKVVEKGKINVSKKVVSEDITVDVPVLQEEVTVEKKIFNQYIDTAPPATRQDGDTTIVSVVKEVLVVEKRLMLVEELHITKHRTQTTSPTTETLRKEEVTVSRTTNL